MRRPIAVTLALAIGLLVAFTAYVWVGNWFTTRTATGASIFGSGSCLCNGESFNYVVHVALGVVQNPANRGARVEMTTDTLKVRKSPPVTEAADISAGTPGCVIRKSDWPGVAEFRVDSPLEGSALTPLGQTLLVRDYDTDYWKISASRGLFPMDVRWK